TSPIRSRRRATLSARRTKKGALVGFHAKRSDVVVEVPDCQLVTDRIRAALPLLGQMATTGGSRKGVLSVLMTDSDGGLDLVVTGGKPLDAELHQTLAHLAQTADLARLTWNDDGVALRRPPLQMFDGIAVTPPPGAFLQATTHGETALRQAVMPALDGAKRVADLFAGCGTFALPMARHAQVHAVETNAAMLRALDQGWRTATGLRHVTTETRDLFRNPLLPEELARFDCVVLDPPRAGAEAQVTALAASDVPVVAYVSCNPVTFARDALRLLACGYDMGPVTVVDQFRWSSHVELCAVFTKP
ncbi:MAG: class I SAM-dependent RNA methyltransferase, partial [Paracoccaceae bacterium]